MGLFLKTALFTVIVPGTVAVLVPLFLVAHRTVVVGPTLWLAIILFTLGIVLYLRTAWDFAVIGKGTPAPIDPPVRLVTRGPYRYSRNPMYISILTIIAAWAALFGSAILVVYAVAMFVIYSLIVRFFEEPHLAREFGHEYEEYAERVGRWLPRIPR